jgi:RNA polymerase sigma-70 factor (ECF subfamily)
MTQRVTALRQTAFEDFYRLHREPVFRALTATIGDYHLAAEATDEGMVRAYQRWRTVRRYENPSGWVYRVALNWARSRMRRGKREIAADHTADPPTADTPGFDPGLLAAVQELPIEYRTVIVLKYVLDWTQPEIAAALDISVGTVKSRLSRGLDQLKNKKGVRREL